MPIFHLQVAHVQWLMHTNVSHFAQGWDQFCSVLNAPVPSWIRPWLGLTCDTFLLGSFSFPTSLMQLQVSPESTPAVSIQISASRMANLNSAWLSVNFVVYKPGAWSLLASVSSLVKWALKFYFQERQNHWVFSVSRSFVIQMFCGFFNAEHLWYLKQIDND